jgi:hypothetical protein
MRRVLVAFSALALFALRAKAQTPVGEEPEANPGRPTVSTPATLTPAGYLQFETGLSAANHSPEFSSRFAPNEVIKFSVHPRLEFLASSEPVVHYRVAGQSANRVAEIFLGAQAVLIPGEGAKPTLAVSYFHRAYDGGAPEFDFGSPKNSVLLLASAEVKGFHYDANGAQGPVRPEPNHFASANGQVHSLRRDLAFYATLLARECRGQPLGCKLRRPQNSSFGCRLQSRTHQHLHALGSLRRFHLPASPPYSLTT